MNAKLGTSWLAVAFGLLLACAASAETIVLVGDSISAGVGASSPRRAYAWQLERSLSRSHRVVNYSRGGWAVSGEVGISDPANFLGAAALWPDVVVIALGTNDYGVGVPLEDFIAGYEAALQTLGPVETVVCVTPYRRSDLSEATPNTAGLLLDDYRTAVHGVCEADGRIVLDGIEAMPSESMLGDGLHPNDVGHNRIAKWMERELTGILD